MKSPHVSPEPPKFLPDDLSNASQNSSSRSSKFAWPGKVPHFMKQKKTSTLTRESLQVLAAVEDKKYYSSPYYKGLLNTEKVPGTSTSPEAEISTATATATGVPHEIQNWNLSSPYYKGLLYTEKVPGTSTNPEVENIASGGSTHDLQSLDPSSPYYRGLLYRATSPDRESQTSSRTSFSVRMSEWSASCFSFKTKDEKDPTMIKVYSTENSNEESLRERVSEPSLSPPTPAAMVVPPSSPPLPPPAAKKMVVNAKDTSELKEEKYLWADRYRPVALKDFICNKDKAIELQHTINEDECRHFIFEGQAGVGKRTMIWALLREAYGPDKVQARDECKTFNLKGEDVSSIMVNVKESSQHVEINLSELKGFEKHVIVELIKETNNLTNKTGLRCSNDNCRAIILHEADKLSTDALLYIRWVIERYRGCHKIFFCCQDASKLQPLKNICKLVQLLPPSNKEIVQVLEFIAKNEEIELPNKLAERIAVSSKNNLRQAIRSFEATSQNNSLLEEDQVILTGWEDDIANIARSIVEKQSPKQLYDIRRKLQNLIDHSVPPEFIFETLAVELKKNVEESMHKQIEKTYKEYSGADKHRHANDERKKLIHQFMSIEEFIAKFMSCYKNHLAKKAIDMTEIKEETT
ncbi:hypothetical protein Lser_V15G31849 [Lactuca serriola]